MLFDKAHSGDCCFAASCIKPSPAAQVGQQLCSTPPLKAKCRVRGVRGALPASCLGTWTPATRQMEQPGRSRARAVVPGTRKCSPQFQDFCRFVGASAALRPFSTSAGGSNSRASSLMDQHNVARPTARFRQIEVSPIIKQWSRNSQRLLRRATLYRLSQPASISLCSLCLPPFPGFDSCYVLMILRSSWLHVPSDVIRCLAIFTDTMPVFKSKLSQLCDNRDESGKLFYSPTEH